MELKPIAKTLSYANKRELMKSTREIMSFTGE